MKRLTVAAVLLLVSTLSFAERFEASGTGKSKDSRAAACASAKDNARSAVASDVRSTLLQRPSNSVEFGQVVMGTLKGDTNTGECSCDKNNDGEYTCEADASFTLK